MGTVQRLQAALDRSRANASALSRSLFADSTWDAPRVTEFVNEIATVSVSTVTAAGEPHAAVVIGACLDGDLYFTVIPGALLGRNLERAERVAFTICTGSHAVMGRGRARLAARSLDAPDLIERLAAVMPRGSFTPPGWDGLVYRVEIERIFAS
jgi:hypothetical protein